MSEDTGRPEAREAQGKRPWEQAKRRTGIHSKSIAGIGGLGMPGLSREDTRILWKGGYFFAVAACAFA